MTQSGHTRCEVTCCICGARCNHSTGSIFNHHRATNLCSYRYILCRAGCIGVIKDSWRSLGNCEGACSVMRSYHHIGARCNRICCQNLVLSHVATCGISSHSGCVTINHHAVHRVCASESNFHGQCCRGSECCLRRI